MLDSDLADLYGVETKYLNKQVQRNIERFPDDFAFKLTNAEWENLRFQFGTSSLESSNSDGLDTILKSQVATSKLKWGGRRYPPYVFTETGIAMLSSVLNSKRSIEVNISIMRIFIKLRSFYMLEKNFEEKVNSLKKDTNKVFKVVFERLDNLENSSLKLPSRKRKIGLNEK